MPEETRGRRWRRRLWRLLKWGTAAFLLVGGALMFEMWTAFGQPPKGEHLARIQQSPRYIEGRFRNALRRYDHMWDAARRWVKGGPNREPDAPPPIERRQASDYATPPASGLRITWFGHSSMLIEIDGVRLLTDPVWGKRASPSRLGGPARFHEPPMALEDLPALDAVVISHDHYDHLDWPTITRLLARDVRFITPLGVGAHLQYWGVPAERITELDWWGQAQVGAVTLHCTPARHFSGRFLGGTDQTLWASWAMVGPDHRAYFSGDGAMSPDFAVIGERLGPFDVTLMESGAYDPAWADVHMGPEQAVEAHRALRGRVLMPVHWGTFNLALHGWTEPVERLLAAAKPLGVPVVVPKPGGWFEPDAPPALVRWWPELPWQPASETPIVSSGLAQALPAPDGVAVAVSE
ncbi:MAG: MBL fold metallo-hydrolase [Myxococcales bacterium]|nr:MBL fold metallo-hydrolase [Myxococcales bacterium]MCB9525143.1 MBL fold metallo-hydrolase [Myxococcales bacterium]